MSHHQSFKSPKLTWTDSRTVMRDTTSTHSQKSQEIITKRCHHRRFKTVQMKKSWLEDSDIKWTVSYKTTDDSTRTFTNRQHSLETACKSQMLTRSSATQARRTVGTGHKIMMKAMHLKDPQRTYLKARCMIWQSKARQVSSRSSRPLHSQQGATSALLWANSTCHQVRMHLTRQLPC